MGGVPLGRGPLEQLAAPDVVDEHVDVTMASPDLLGQRLHLLGIEVVDGGRNAVPAELRDQLRGLFDRLWPVVFGSGRACRAARADDRCARFTECRCDIASSAAGRSGDESNTTAERVSIG